MNQEKVGSFIAESRKLKKMTQQKLAEKLGVSDKTIGNWENGRNMPDLSLFKPLCEELDITINDLMSGEEIKKENYQEKFEENIINLTIDNKKKSKKKLKLFIIIFTICASIILIANSLYNTMELNVNYDSRLMKCHFTDDKFIYEITGISVLNTNYIERVIDNKKYLIFHSTVNLYNKRHSNWEYRESLANSVNKEEITFGYGLYIEYKNHDYLDYENTIVYYTNKSLSKIKKMKDSDLKKELEESYQMCSMK
jgi:Predicted transcriptional regulators